MRFYGLESSVPDGSYRLPAAKRRQWLLVADTVEKVQNRASVKSRPFRDLSEYCSDSGAFEKDIEIGFERQPTCARLLMPS
jgi:hypothetical protein